MTVRRLARDGAAVASAGLCVTFAALWARSFVASDAITVIRNHPGTSVWHRQAYGVHTGRGGFQAIYLWSWTDDRDFVAIFRRRTRAGEPQVYTPHGPPRSYPSSDGAWPPAPPGLARSLGLEGYAGWLPFYGVERAWGIQAVVPFWLPVVAFAAVPAWRVCRWRRRRPAGACPSCGYDLRASPDRCPECGAPNATPAVRR